MSTLVDKHGALANNAPHSTPGPRMQVLTEERCEGVSTFTFDRPPVNALATTVRRALDAALAAAESDDAVVAVVLAGAGRMFSGGADLAEFTAGTAMDSPTLHGDLLPRIAAMTKPVVAAVHDAALGGGFELALGCHARVFATGSRVGLPETALGLMPGAGGTQWLPRAIGVERAARAIVDAIVAPIETYADTRLADAVVDRDRLHDVARAVAIARAERGPPFAAWSTAPLPAVDVRTAVERVRADLAARRTTLPGMHRALDAIAMTATHPVADGMPLEHALFAPLIASVEARALRHAFVAERKLRGDRDSQARAATLAARLVEALRVEVDALATDGRSPAAIAAALDAWGWSDVSGWLGVSGPATPAIVAVDPSSSIVERLLAAAADAGSRAIDDGVAATAADIDAVMIRACGFPRVRGGPMFQADERRAGGRTANPR